MKATFIVFLFSVFLCWFGVPSIKRYLDNKTHIVTTIESSEGVPAPAVTICGHWRDNTTNYQTENVINKTCILFDDVQTCIENNTFKFGELVFSAKTELNISLHDYKLWIEDFTVPNNAKCFTFEMPIMLSSDSHFDSFWFIFKQAPTLVFIHDPKYFVLNFNPSMPSILKSLGAMIPSPILRLQMTRHHKKNLPSRPCEEDEEYNFQVS